MKKQFLAVTALLTLAGSCFAAAKPGLIPADVKGIAVVQVQAFANSPFFKALEAKMPAEAMTTGALTDPKKVKESTIFLTEKWAAIFVESAYTQDEIVKELTKENASTQKTIFGKTALIDTAGNVAVAFLKPGEMLAVSPFDEAEKAEAVLAYLLNPKTKKLAANAPLAKALAPKPNQYLYGVVTDLDQMLAANPEAKAQIAAQFPGAEKLLRAIISLSSAESDAVRLSGKLVSANAEDAKSVQQGLLNLKTGMAIFAMQLPALNPVIKSFNAKQTAAANDFSLTVRAADIEAIVGGVMGQLMQGFSADGAPAGTTTIKMEALPAL